MSILDNRPPKRIVLVLLSALVLGCSMSSALTPVSTDTPVPTATDAATFTPAPTHTPEPTNTPEPTATPKLMATRKPTAKPTATKVKVEGPDLTGAELVLSDLPEGFEEISESDLAAMNMSVEDLNASMSSGFQQATMHNFTAFLEPSNFQMVMGMLMSPLTSMEKAGFDVILEDPDQVVKLFAGGLAGNSEVSAIEGLDKFGDASIGVTALMPSDPISMRMDMTIVRRGEVIEMILLLYRDGKVPDVTVGDLAQILDDRLAEVLGK